MDDPCLNYNLVQLRDMARGKIPGFSKMKKQELCQALNKAQLIPRGLTKTQSPLPPTLFQGISPPAWDFDKQNPIPNFLLPYDYIYAAGSSVKEVIRHFILPDNFPLVGIQLPGAKGKIPRRDFDLTVLEYQDHLDQEEESGEILQPYFIGGEEVTINIVYIKGLQRGKPGFTANQVAPRIGSRSWFNLLDTLQIVDMEGENTFDAQLRREYQTITVPARLVVQ